MECTQNTYLAPKNGELLRVACCLLLVACWLFVSPLVVTKQKLVIGIGRGRIQDGAEFRTVKAIHVQGADSSPKCLF